MCAYKIAPFQARTLPLLLEHVGGYPSITSVLKEGYFCSKKSWMDGHGAVSSLRNMAQGLRCLIAFLFHVPIALDCS